MPKKIKTADLIAPCRVIIKTIPGNEEEVLISPYPQVKDSIVRSYYKLALEMVEEMTETSEVYSSMGRSFKVVDLKIKSNATIPLAGVLAHMIDEKVVEPRTQATLQVSWNAVSNEPKGGIYVMGSCESCWCDSVYC